MKVWKNMQNAEKVNVLHSFISFYNNVYKNFIENPTARKNIEYKIESSSNDSYRDYVILYLLDKKYTVIDGFHFLSAAGFNIPEEDQLAIMAEKFDISFDELTAFYYYQRINMNTVDCILDKQFDSFNRTVQHLFEDLTTRIEIFVEAHDEKFKKENPERYMELLNSPITSLLSIKLSNNPRINKALAKRMNK